MESRTRLKQRLSRLLRPSAMLRNSCNSAASGSTFSPSSAAAAAIISHDPLFIPQDSLFNDDRSLSLSSFWRLRSLDCSGGCRSTKAASDVVTAAAKAIDSKKKERRVRETGELYEIRESPASPCKKKGKATTNKKKKKKKKLLSNPYGFTSSADDDDNGSEFFSSGNEDETEAFFSSRSFSSDSSEFYKRPSSSKKNKNKNKDKKQSSSTTTTRSPSSSSRRVPPRRRMSFRPVVSVEEEERRSGIPVMKRSTDPYVDFCSSMVEMIVERQIFGARDLERLLHSYLSLNSPSHHSVIVRALADISQVLFGH